jgi:ACS family hexuronate transporter-like MFS transporter
MNSATDAPEVVDHRRFRLRGYRWVICAAIFIIISFNYIDRFVLSELQPTLHSQLHIGDIGYGQIVAAFAATFGLGYALCGWFMDKVGIRLGFLIIVVAFSLAEAAMALANGVMGFVIANALLGLTQAATFPGAIKAIGQWFPQKERALVIGIANGATSVGVILAPILVSLSIAWFGWRGAFVVAGSLGLLWVVWWGLRYRDPASNPHLSQAELDYIGNNKAAPEPHIPWVALLGYRQSWAYIIAVAMTGPIWWFYLAWIPNFFNKQHHLNIKGMILPVLIIYGLADAGSVFGGWLSSWLLAGGWSANAARKTAMLVCALCVMPVFIAARCDNLWLAALLLGLATGGHQGFSSNIYAMACDTMPGKVLGSLVGLGGLVGSGISAFAALAVGWLLHVTHNSYTLLFAIPSLAYLATLLVIHLINPQWLTAQNAATPAVQE